MSNIIYNLFPRHFPNIDQWKNSLSAIKSMQFNAVYVNPFHETGFSGSLYSIKNYYRLNPLFLDGNCCPDDFSKLISFIDECKKENLLLIMDLVINHTAIDSHLIGEHPSWYVWENGRVKNPFCVDPATQHVTVWGDLALINNEYSSDKENLWKYWDNLISFFQNLGILGFRCDAAYQVSDNLWKYLIGNARKRNSETIFYAETLGCSNNQIESLRNCGFDYFFNSSKWWSFDSHWLIEHHNFIKNFAPTVSFPESHDTERLAASFPGNEEFQKSRYAFAAIFSKALLMPMGYEYGSKKRIDVVHGTINDVDNKRMDICDWIKQMNDFKKSNAIFSEEGWWRNLTDYNSPYIFLEKGSTLGNGSVFVCINKNPTGTTTIDGHMIPHEIKRCDKFISLLKMKTEGMKNRLEIGPADILVFK